MAEKDIPLRRIEYETSGERLSSMAAKAARLSCWLRLSCSLTKHMADGPGKLCAAMGIPRADNAADMVENALALKRICSKVEKMPRI